MSQENGGFVWLLNRGLKKIDLRSGVNGFMRQTVDMLANDWENCVGFLFV